MTDYLLTEVLERVKKDSFITWLFAEYGVARGELSKIRWTIQNLGTEEYASIDKTKTGLFLLRLHWKICIPRFGHIIVHELNHFLRTKTNCELNSSDDYWSRPEEIECLLREAQWLKNYFYASRRNSRRLGLAQLVETSEYPKDYLAYVWDLA